MAKKQHTMNVSLTPQLAKEVADRVKSGEYASSSEVMRGALRALKTEEQRRREQIRRLRALVDEGIRSAERGELIPADEVFAELRAGLKRRKRKRAA